jgi:hypothetical protein
MGIEPTTSAWEAEVLPLNYTRIIGGGTRIRTGDEGFADLCLTTWLCRREKRKTGLEPATPTLARWCSTTELLPQFGWASWIRTSASRSQSPLPYRLAIAQ